MPIPKGKLPEHINGQPPQPHVRVIKLILSELDLNKLVERAQLVESERNNILVEE